MKTIEESIISRYKLLMEYDTSKTLVENLTVITEAPNPFSSLVKSVSKNTVDDVIRSAKGGLKTTAGKAIANTDDLIKALEKNLVSAANIGKVRTGLMKSSSLRLADKAVLIDDFVKNPNVYNKYKNLNQRDIVTRFKGAGYPDDVAKEIARKIRGQAGQMKRITPQIQKILKDANDKVLKAGARKWNWSQWLKWGAGIGIGAATVYTIVQLLKDDGTLPENPEGTPETSPENGGGGGQTGGDDFPLEKGAYTTPGDPYQYKVVECVWYTKSWKNRGTIISEWKSLANNKKATDILDGRHPDARKACLSGGTPTPSPTPTVTAELPPPDDLYGIEQGTGTGTNQKFDSTVSNISGDKLDDIE